MDMASLGLDDNYTLDDRYTRARGRVYLSGVQALVRLFLDQHRRDVEAGLDTAAFISGYRGSPLGMLDHALWQASAHLGEHNIRFEPGLNEDIAATSVWGTQQAMLLPGARHDGVFAAWYGKGPGVDRSGDAFKHGNFAGTAPNGGVLVFFGDDHGAKSSTTAHQSEPALIAAMIPVLNPATIQDYLDFGLWGWALSRFSGLWVGLKCVSETVDGAASCHVGPDRAPVILPDDVPMPPGGLNIRLMEANLGDPEERVLRYRLPAARAFVRANGLDRVVIAAPRPRLGIITTGKAYLDVRQALRDLGLDDEAAAALGISVLKLALTWPIEPEIIRDFAERQTELLVIEEKRAIIEDQVASLLFNIPADKRPRLIGKTDETGAPLLPDYGELDPDMVARAIVSRLRALGADDSCLAAGLARLEARTPAKRNVDAPNIVRLPYFCSGCPHNTSTRVPDGSLAMAGIGCHTMALWMPDRPTLPPTQMGGEGGNWIGMAPFVEIPHMFQNLGDGTYFHSGLLAIRAAVAAGVNITYKLLYNDAVAMTGGQPVEGHTGVATISRQLADEGVKRIAVVSDDPGKYGAAGFAPGVTIHHRDELDAVQRTLREVPGVTALIYDQTCAAELRRRRKRGTAPDRDERVFIASDICEGCGDCGVQSNCVSLQPLETPLGRKRTVNQSSCNKDYSCLKGFCPALISVRGARLRKTRAEIPEEVFADLPAPEAAALTGPYGILVTGIGGTGVVTVGHILAMAAHLEGKGCSVLDMTGLAQKNGAVVSHLRIAPAPEDLNAPRLGLGEADVLLGCDIIVAGAAQTLAQVNRDSGHAVINEHLIPTAALLANPDVDFQPERFAQAIAATTGPDRSHFIDATRVATALFGDAVYANMVMLGFACQLGLYPVGVAAIERAIRLNGVAVEDNLRAFAAGRACAAVPERLRPILGADETAAADAEDPGLEALIEDRAARLVAYQNQRLAGRYRALIDRVAAAERAVAAGHDELARTVARIYYKLLAYKDEYEVARLFSDPAFRRSLDATFEGPYRLAFHLAPPILGGKPSDGRPKKRRFGPWLRHLFPLLARMKGLRGTAFDPFGRSADRRLERELISEYEALVGDLLDGLTPDVHARAVEIAGAFDAIRGFGPVKAEAARAARARAERLMKAYRAPPAQAAE